MTTASRNSDRTQSDINAPGYNAAGLLDVVMARCKARNDAALAKLLDVAPSMISKLRNNVIPVGAVMMIRFHDAASMSLDQIRAYLGMPAADHEETAAS